MRTNDNVTLLDRETEGLFFAVLGILIFSLSTPATRVAAPLLGGLFVGLARGVVGGILGLIWLLRHRPRFRRADLLPILLVSLGSVLGFPVLSGLAMARVPASHGLVFSALLPAATALYASLRLGEKTSPRFWLSLGAGVALVVRYALRGGGGELGTADLMIASGILLCAMGYAEAGRLSTRLGGPAVLAASLVISLPITLPATILVALTSPPHGGPTAWACLGYTSFFSTWLGFQCWYRGMALGGVAKASQLQPAQSLLGLGWASLLLGEPLSLELVATAVGVLLCVALGRTRSSRSTPPIPVSSLRR